MDEKYISDLYNQLGGKSVFGEYNDFKSLIMSDDSYASDVYNQMGGESVFGKYDDFRSLTKAPSNILQQPTELKKKKILRNYLRGLVLRFRPYQLSLRWLSSGINPASLCLSKYHL